MPDLTYTSPTVGNPHSTEDPKTRNALIAIKSLFNGLLDADNLADGAVTDDKIETSLAAALGINNAANTGRGYSAVATSQSTSSSSITDLATVGPSVTVTVPTGGWVYVYAEATCDPAASGGAAQVALVEATDISGGVQILSKSSSSASMATVPGSISGADKSAYLGGFLQLVASAGSRTYKLQYRRTGGSGNVTFSNRRLYVIAGGPMA